MNNKQKISLYLITGSVFIIFLLYSIFWFSYSSNIKEQIRILTSENKYPEFTIETKSLENFNFPFAPSTKWSGNINFTGKGLSIFIPSAIISGFAINYMNISFKLPKGFSIGKDEWDSVNIIDELDFNIETPANFMKEFNKSEALRWRNSGGKFKIKPSYFKAREITIDGYGDFYLDENLQIAGILNVKITNPRHLVKILSDNNAMDFITVTILNGLISGLAKKEENSYEEIIETTIKINNNKLYVGMLQLGDVPNIIWN